MTNTSSLGVFDHLPVSIGSLMLLHLNFVIMFLLCGNNNIMLNLSIIDNVQFKWLNSIKSIFEKTGLNYLWNHQQPVHSVQLKFNVKQNLTDQ
jgi:hypothetical protein